MKNYYKKRIKNLIKILLAPVSERTPETFHQLRVEIKKIRAFYTFVLFTHKKFPERKYMNPFNELFKFAGKVRETHIFEKILKDLNLD